ncbi:MAG: sodium:calcium antiporter [Dehalococcoidia bacterium]|nr:sodium:calcium antiporter [Dehalococcoidia bacterium]
MVWIYFAICVLLILFAGRRVAIYGNIIAERTGLGGAWIGVVLIAVVTSLPELFTGISSVTLVGAPDLTIGNLLGANTFNLFNLALLDIFNRNGTILTAKRSRGYYLTALYSLIMVSFVTAAIGVSRYFSPGIGWIGWYTPIIIILYLYFARAIFRAERSVMTQMEQKRPFDEEKAPLRSVYLNFGVSAVVIIGAGVWLAIIGDQMAEVTGLGQGFVGSIFLAFTTTLPEITVSFTALRIGAIDLAVANMIGSNLFNMLIIAIDDLLFVDGPILTSVSWLHMVTASAVILMTIVFMVALRFRPRRYFRLSWWNCTLILLLLARLYYSGVIVGAST